MSAADKQPETGMLLSALIYARRGWKVFPLRARSKEPYSGVGVYQATTDEEKIREWWRQWPSSNVAVAMGEGSGIFLLDIDLHKEGCQEDFAELQIKNGPIPETAEASTGKGGLHFFFRHPDFVVHSSTASLGRGIDIKGFGSYAVMAPSVHPDTGKTYDWKNDRDPVDAPSWLLEWLRQAPQRDKLKPEDIEQIPKGKRNDTLFRLACSLRTRGLNAVEITGALHPINRGRCEIPLPENQVESIALSACRYKPSDPILHSPNAAKPTPELVAISAPDLMNMDIPPRRMLIEPWLGHADQAVIYGKTGHGKTWVTLGAALVLSSGGSIFGWSAQNPARVLFVDGEMMMRRLQSRLATLVRSIGVLPSSSLSIITPDLQTGFSNPVNLYTKEGRGAIERHVDSIGGVDAIVFDNISTLYRGGEENTSEWWQPFQDWIVEWKMRGVATVTAIHSGKDGDRGPRGASKILDALELSLEVKQPDDWTPADGARFFLQFHKTRDLKAGMEPVEVELSEDEWAIKTPKGASREGSLTEEEMDARVLSAVLGTPGATWSMIRQGLGKSAAAAAARNRLENAGLIRTERGYGLDRKMVVWPSGNGR